MSGSTLPSAASAHSSTLLQATTLIERKTKERRQETNGAASSPSGTFQPRLPWLSHVSSRTHLADNTRRASLTLDTDGRSQRSEPVTESLRWKSTFFCSLTAGSVQVNGSVLKQKQVQLKKQLKGQFGSSHEIIRRPVMALVGSHDRWKTIISCQGLSECDVQVLFSVCGNSSWIVRGIFFTFLPCRPLFPGGPSFPSGP